jgi:hypothetical protein
MIKKIVKIQDLTDHDANSSKNDLAYWMDKSPEERINTVEYLRRQFHGSTARLLRSARVIQKS